MRFEAGHCEIHKCTDLWNRKPTLRSNEVQWHGGLLVLCEQDLQRSLRALLSNVIRKQPGDPASFGGRRNRGPNAVYHEARRKLN